MGITRWLAALAAMAVVAVAGLPEASAQCTVTMPVEQNNCDGIDNDCDGLTDEEYDDGVNCTASVCVNGVKSNIPQDAVCNDNEPCTFDFCDVNLGCVNLPDASATPDPSKADTNPCTDLRCVDGESVNVNDNTNTPDDGLVCTQQTCQNGSVVTTIQNNRCAVQNTCYKAGQVVSPGDGTCGVCDPAVSQTSLTNEVLNSDFATGKQGWKNTQITGDIGWSVTDHRSYSQPNSMYFGRPDDWNMNFTPVCKEWFWIFCIEYEEPPNAEVQSPWIQVGDDVNLSLEFVYWMDVKMSNTYLFGQVVHDGFEVWVVFKDGTEPVPLWLSLDQGPSANDQTWTNVKLSLAGYGGKEIAIVFRSDLNAAGSGPREGIYIDDVTLTTACCFVPDDCDDGNDCTVELCGNNACRWVDTCACTFEKSNMMFVLDYSGSMQETGYSDPATGTYLSKWEVAVASLDETLGDFQQLVSWAVKTFRTPNYGDSCSVDPDSLEVPFGTNRTDTMNWLYSQWPDGSTPMGLGLEGADNVYANMAGLTGQKFVVLISDGADTCGGDPVQAVQDLYDNGIPTFVVGFGGGIDKDVLNAAAYAGGQARDGATAFWSASTAGQMQEALSTIVASAGDERCNGVDDDCDGETDEDLPGVLCEVDCNGTTLIGYQYCVDGALGPCSFDASTETCNGVDDNCNGEIDEVWKDDIGLKLGDPCNVGVGGCGQDGVYICNPTGFGEPICNVSASPPEPEICDGIDNDCNGLTDEGLAQLCDLGCGVGVELCQGGVYSGCDAPAPPCADDTTCDNVDNDGNGITDDAFPLRGQPCDGADSDQCANGTWTCADPSSLECVNETVTDILEVCDGIDNDCDGLTDEEGADGCTSYYYDGDTDTYGTGAARCLCFPSGLYTATVDGDCNDTDSLINPGAAEVCDGIDNECDGYTDEDPEDPSLKMTQPCYTGPAGTMGVGTCAEGERQCNGAAGWGSCQNEVLPTAVETCDGMDTDCDGVADDDEPGVTGLPEDHPCWNAAGCEFGTCYCLENPGTNVWSCALE